MIFCTIDSVGVLWLVAEDAEDVQAINDALTSDKHFKRYPGDQRIIYSANPGTKKSLIVFNYDDYKKARLGSVPLFGER